MIKGMSITHSAVRKPTYIGVVAGLYLLSLFSIKHLSIVEFPLEQLLKFYCISSLSLGAYIYLRPESIYNRLAELR